MANKLGDQEKNYSFEGILKITVFLRQKTENNKY